jgi:hypothetical protein
MQLDESPSPIALVKDETYVNGWRLFCWLPVVQALATPRFRLYERCTNSDSTSVPTFNILANKNLYSGSTRLRATVAPRSIRPLFGHRASNPNRNPEVSSGTSQHGLELYVHFALHPHETRRAMFTR